MAKMTPEELERQRRNRERLMEVAERGLAEVERREPRPLPKTDAEYREWRRPFDDLIERLRARWLAELGERP